MSCSPTYLYTRTQVPCRDFFYRLNVTLYAAVSLWPGFMVASCSNVDIRCSSAWHDRNVAKQLRCTGPFQSAHNSSKYIVTGMVIRRRTAQRRLLDASVVTSIDLTGGRAQIFTHASEYVTILSVKSRGTGGWY